MRRHQWLMEDDRAVMNEEDFNQDQAEQKKSPLIPIGLTIMAVLLVPVLMYSMGPEGPIKKGDVVFSTGQHRVYFEDADAYEAFGYHSFCVLEARDQLLVLESAGTRSDGTFVAQPLGTVLREFPSCPTSARIILHVHQLTLKADMWGGAKRYLNSVVFFKIIRMLPFPTRHP